MSREKVISMQSPSDQSIQIKRQQRQQKVALNFKFSCYEKFYECRDPSFFRFYEPSKEVVRGKIFWGVGARAGWVSLLLAGELNDQLG